MMNHDQATPPLDAEAMNEPEPKRPWWRNKRWWATGFLWLVIAYPLNLGPLVYAVARAWANGCGS